MEQPTEKQLGFAETLGIENPSQYDKKTLSGMINAKVGKEDKPKPADNKFFAKAPSSSPKDDKAVTMYTSYAKEIFCAMLYPIAMRDTPITSQALMNEAVNLVKQAKEAFI